MASLDYAKELISKSKFRDAAHVLDQLISKDRDNDELWYLRAVVSLKLKNYEGAHESLERAIFIKKKSDYYKLKGVAHLQVYDVEHAIMEFSKALSLNPRDAPVYFFLSLCFMLINDPRSRNMLQNAYLLDKKRTKELARSFYQTFFHRDFSLDAKTKAEIEKSIEKISA